MGGNGNTVEVDETYIGRLKGAPVKSGGAHKNSVVTLVERGGRARSFHVDTARMGNVMPIVRANIAKESAFRPGDSFALRVMQPLRVRSGGLALSVPVSYDYSTLAAGYESRFFNLAPTGRELDVEAVYGVTALGGRLTANAFVRRQPGNIAALSPDVGAAMRFSLGF